MSVRLKAIVIALVVCCLTQITYGRLVDTWDYKRLFKEADLIVIAAPIGEEKANDEFGKHHWQIDVVGMNTEFEICQVIKGKLETKKIKMLHFRFDPPKDKLLIVEDGPNFVAVRRQSLRVKEGEKVLDLPAPEYLLFLRPLKDGRYEPVSGRIDPAFAVREVSVPLDDTFGKRQI